MVLQGKSSCVRISSLSCESSGWIHQGQIAGRKADVQVVFLQKANTASPAQCPQQDVRSHFFKLCQSER